MVHGDSIRYLGGGEAMRFGTLVMRREGDKVYVESADDLIGVSPDILVNGDYKPFRLSQHFFGDWIVIHDGEEVYAYTPLYWDHTYKCLVLRRVHGTV